MGPVLGILLLFTTSVPLAARESVSWRPAAGWEDTELVWLSAAKRSFPALYAEPTGDLEAGAVIVVHGFGQHPDWPDIIGPIREHLPEHGWHTLAIEMPAPDGTLTQSRFQRLVTRAGARIQAAERYLKERKLERVVLVGYGFGAGIAALFSGAKEPPDIAGLVSINPVLPALERTPAQVSARLARLRVPLLDILADGAHSDSERLLATRTRAARRLGLTGYRQIRLAATGVRVGTADAPVVRRLRGWLQRQFSEPRSLSGLGGS